MELIYWNEFQYFYWEKDDEKKIRVTLTIDRQIDKYISENENNKSKYVEKLILQDLIKKNVDIANL